MPSSLLSTLQGIRAEGEGGQLRVETTRASEDWRPWSPQGTGPCPSLGGMRSLRQAPKSSSSTATGPRALEAEGSAEERCSLVTGDNDGEGQHSAAAA